jgi:bifunctional non-homologous end joining protein LigD
LTEPSSWEDDSRELKGKSTMIVVAFDLLYLNGRDIRKLPLV